MIYCPNCGAANKAGNKFCIECGQAFPAPHEPEVESVAVVSDAESNEDAPEGESRDVMVPPPAPLPVASEPAPAPAASAPARRASRGWRRGLVALILVVVLVVAGVGGATLLVRRQGVNRASPDVAATGPRHTPTAIVGSRSDDDSDDVAVVAPDAEEGTETPAAEAAADSEPAEESVTPRATLTATLDTTATLSRTPSPTRSATRTRTPMRTRTPTRTLTSTPTVTETPTSSTTPTATVTAASASVVRFSYTICGAGNCDIFVWDASSGSPAAITNDPVVNKQADWSPDGQWLVFVSLDADGRERLAIFDSATGQTVPVGDATDNKVFPSWSPDGNEILYQQYDDSDVHVRAFNLTTQESRLLTHASGPWNKTPQWSPVGDRVAFSAAPSDSNGDGVVNDNDQRFLFSMDRDGNNLTRLTNEPGFYDMYPYWLPDGRHIVFSRHVKAALFNDNDPGDIYLLDTVTGSVRPLTRTSADEVMAVPSLSGDQMLVEYDSNGTFEIYLASWNGEVLGESQFVVNGEVPAWFPALPP
ncbi:MAG TPA: zinc-ribbon domain-containing protein [Ardenticatenaceae bacterium]